MRSTGHAAKALKRQAAPADQSLVARRIKSPEDLLGSILLGWRTRIRSTGRVVGQTQLWGTVVRAGENGLVLEDPMSGSQEVVPWDPGSLTPAEPGVYRLRDSRVALSDPDWLAFWVVRRPRARRRPLPATLRVVR